MMTKRKKKVKKSLVHKSILNVLGFDDDLLVKAKYISRKKVGDKWVYDYGDKKDSGKGKGGFKSETDLNKMSELEVSKYSNDLRMKRNKLSSANKEGKKELQTQIDLTDKIRAEKKAEGKDNVEGYTKSKRSAHSNISKEQAEHHAEIGRKLDKKVKVVKNSNNKYDLWIDKP